MKLLDFMSNIRPKFEEKDFNTVFRELCSEARRRIWKKKSKHSIFNKWKNLQETRKRIY